MVEKILIPLDGSELGERALHYVEEMMSRMSPAKKVEAILFQVVSPRKHTYTAGDGVVTLAPTAEEMEEAKARALEYLNKSGEGLRSKGIAVTDKVAVISEDVSAAGEIIKAEEETKADLVAMSTHGRRGITRWAFGSVTEKVLHAGKVPVLLVRAAK